MKNALLVIFVLLMLSGCSLLDPVQKGSQTVTYYDAAGKPTHSVSEPIAVGDKATEYGKNVREVVKQRAVAVSKIADTIKETMQPKPDDDEKVAAYKEAMGLMALDRLAGSDSSKEIAAIHYGKDKYDVSDTAVKEGAGVGKFGIAGYTAKKIVDKVSDGAGDKAETHVNGDGSSSTTNTKRTSVNTESHTTASDESTATGTSTPTATSDPVTNVTNEAAPAAEEPVAEEPVAEEPVAE